MKKSDWILAAAVLLAAGVLGEDKKRRDRMKKEEGEARKENREPHT